MWNGMTPSLFSHGMLDLMYEFQIKIANKVLEQSTGNQLQEQLKNSAFRRGIAHFCQPFHWTAYLDKLETSIMLKICCKGNRICLITLDRLSIQELCWQHLKRVEKVLICIVDNFTPEQAIFCTDMHTFTVFCTRVRENDKLPPSREMKLLLAIVGGRGTFRQKSPQKCSVHKTW